MFGASSPPLTLGCQKTAAVRQTLTTNAPGHLISCTLLVGAAAAALGVSALVGRSLYASVHHADDTAPSSSASVRWWSRVAQRLRISGFVEAEDDDAFSSGTGAANLFDEEKIKARQQFSRDKAKHVSRSHIAAATTTAAAAGAASARASAAPPKAVGPVKSTAKARKDALTALASAEGIQERERHMKLVRAFLQREGGISYDDDDDSSTSSDSTDVSLNYHLATAMEGNARDELLMAFSTFADFVRRSNDGSPSLDADEENAAGLELNTMVKTLEYLDMSNEREKLRSRRIAMYHEAGRATPVSSIDSAEGDDDDDDDDNLSGDMVDMMNSMYHRYATHRAAAHYGMPSPMQEGDEDEDYGEDSRNAVGRQAFNYSSELMPGDYGMGAGGSVLERILGVGSAVRGNAAIADGLHHSYAARHADHADMMEDGWDAEDEEEEVDLMAYLQQADNASHFYSREEMRRARRDPANDIRIVGMDDNAWGEEDAESEWEDEMGEDDMTGMEESNADIDEEDNYPTATPWSRHHKESFEKKLFAHIRDLAGSIALTDAMAEQVVSQEDARRETAREKKQHQGQLQSSTSVAGTASAAKVDDYVGEDEEWEDEADWEDA